MARSQPHRPPVPPPAERARALVHRAARAAMIAGAEVPADPERLADAGDDTLRVVPNLHHVPATGRRRCSCPPTTRSSCSSATAARLSSR